VSGHGGYWSVARAVGDGFFTCPARRTARTMANAYQASSGSSNNDETSPGGPYLYFFNHTPAVLVVAEPLNPDAAESMGVYHGSEVAFVFDIQPYELGEAFATGFECVQLHSSMYSAVCIFFLSFW